jgi:N-glycosylase/DNA lyase
MNTLSPYLLERAGFPGESLERWRGLRIVRQDLWECLVSFACSSANNIKRIRAMIDAMCLHWGEFVRCDGQAFRTFPRPGALGSERDLRKMGFGFRAAYLAKINKIATLKYEDARARLMELPGVSDKIADCVALFALGHMQAFPVDTWVRRAAMAELFGGEEMSDADIRQRAQARFGMNAGYAQQYLFHEWRRRRG